jgi:hypothetical protein
MQALMGEAAAEDGASGGLDFPAPRESFAAQDRLRIDSVGGHRRRPIRKTSPKV